MATHWDEVYATKPAASVSWYQSVPAMSLRLMAASGLQLGETILDVGAGASVLADELVKLGHTRLVLADISAEGLNVTRQRLGDAVEYVVSDVLDLDSDPAAMWHDRAVFHFLTDQDDQLRYREVMARHVVPQGHAIVATFAADGPERCSGLPVARYSPEALAESFGPHFSLVESGREEHVTPSGSVQPFSFVLLRRDSQP